MSARLSDITHHSLDSKASYSVIFGSNSGKKYSLSSSEGSGEAYSDLR